MPSVLAQRGALALRGRVVTPDRVLADAVVAVADGRITYVGPAAGWTGGTEPAGGTVLPGLVDVHVHGAVGHSFSGGSAAAGRAIARHHHEHGTTTLLASLVSAREPDLLAAVAAAADLADTGAVAGVHLEGPFLSPAHRGAHDRSALRLPDPALLERAVEVGRGHVRTMTYAPELPDAGALAIRARALGVLASVGHTGADARTTTAALAAAGTCVTHLFNAMPPLHHRSPGPVAAALQAAARGLTVLELIADGVHLADEVVGMVVDLVGPDQVALVSDAMAAAGHGDGRYRLGGVDVEVVGGVARAAGDEPAAARALAGGTARSIDVLRRAVRHGGLDLVTAVRAAATTPARLIGLGAELGELRRGQRADLLVVDDELRPVRVLRGGAWLTPHRPAGPDADRRPRLDRPAAGWTGDRRPHR